MSDLTLLGLCGSLRAGSLNRKLMHEAAQKFAPTNFAEGNLRLPLYDGDVEENDGIPAEVQALADQIQAADAVLIVTPEYNKAISGVLKNALDWVSRMPGGVWKGKPVAILSSTAGRTGGEMAQASTRLCLLPFQPNLVVGPDVLVGSNYEQHDESGALTNERYLTAVEELMVNLRAAASQ